MFFDDLYNLCTQRNTTVSEIIRELHLSSGSATKWKNGSIPKFETRMRIASKLNVPLDTFMTDEERHLTSQDQIIDDAMEEIDQTFLSIKNKPTPGIGSELKESETKLIELYRAIPKENQSLVLGMIEAALKNQGLLK